MPTWPIPSIRELLEPTLNHMGYELYALDQSGQSGRTLRISIDHREPIKIEDCERVSRVAGPLLDLTFGSKYHAATPWLGPLVRTTLSTS